MEDIIRWLVGGSSDGNVSDQERARTEQSYTRFIVFGKAHKAENLEANTQTAKLFIALQKHLPNACVLYCSATRVTDIEHMVYATCLLACEEVPTHCIPLLFISERCRDLIVDCVFAPTNRGMLHLFVTV